MSESIGLRRFLITIVGRFYNFAYHTFLAVLCLLSPVYSSGTPSKSFHVMKVARTILLKPSPLLTHSRDIIFIVHLVSHLTETPWLRSGTTLGLADAITKRGSSWRHLTDAFLVLWLIYG